MLSDNNRPYTLTDIQKSKYFSFSFTTKILEDDLKQLLNLGIIEKVSINNIPHYGMKGYKEKAIAKAKDLKYDNACELLGGNDLDKCLMAINLFKEIGDWKDSTEKLRQCEEKVAKLEALLSEKEKQERARIAEEKRQEEIRLKEQKERQAKYRQAGLCQHCGGEIKGLFVKKCVKCGKKKDY